MTTKKDAVRIGQAIVKKLGKAGVEYFKKHGELPAVKLSKEEMDAIKGGLDLKKLVASTPFNPFEIQNKSKE